MDITELCINCFKPTGGEEVCMNCGYIQTDRPRQLCHLYPHTILNERYIIGNVINNGGFGVVYKAYDMKFETVVAIKELLPTQNSMVNRVPGTGKVIPVGEKRQAQFETLKQKFLEEARMMAQFSESESIVHIYDFFEENNTAYLVMEYLDGQTLRQKIGYENAKMSYDEAINIILPIMEALKVAHSHGVIHRDVSPDNIFICKNGKVKLIDFGAAKFKDTETNENTNSVVMKPGYTPPEQYRSKGTIGVYTDIYSVGAVLYTILSGCIPEESIDRLEKDELQKLSKIGVELPVYAEKSIMKAMALRENARFKSMDEFISAIKGEKKADYPEVELKKKKILRAISIVAAFAVMISGVLVAYKVRSNNSLIPSQNETITMWYIDDGDAGLNERWENIEKYFTEYAVSQKKTLSDTKVEIIGIPASEYDEKLKEAFENGEAPDIYESSNSEFDSYAHNLDSLYDQLENENFVSAFDRMKAIYAEDNKIAVYFDVPVLYTYTDYKYISAPKEETSLDSLIKAKSKKGNFKYSLICNPDVAHYAACAYSLGNGNSVDKKTAEKLYDASRTFGKKSYTSPDKIFVREENNAQYYIGFMSEYSSISKEIRAGQTSFDVTQLTGKDTCQYYVFPEVWSISNQSSTSKKQTASLLLYYLACTQDGQSDVTKANRNTYYLPMFVPAIDGIGYAEEYRVIYNGENTDANVSKSEYSENKKDAEEISSLIKKKDSTFKDVKKIIDNQ